MNEGERDRHVLVVGGGFGGLTFCETFHSEGTRVTLVDQENHHLFQPLLYQVATAGLSATDIAQPIRSVLRRDRHITVMMDELRSVDLAQRVAVFEDMTLSYDYLVLALGGRTSYFGHEEWERHAPGLKTLDDALKIRARVLAAFERAERETDPVVRRKLMRMVVIGGGPTGVEMAGALAELRRFVLRREFRKVNPAEAEVILIEASELVLDYMGAEQARRTAEQLASLGVEIRTGCRVKAIHEHGVGLEGGEVIEAENVIWAAGVAASPLAASLGLPCDRAGRVHVQADLSLEGHPEVFCIGDMAHVPDGKGGVVPGVAQGAMQMARFVAEVIAGETADRTAPSGGRRPGFEYRDKGTMATIGRSRAVATIGRWQFSGLPAWLVWLVIHLMFLIDFRNKVIVLFRWVVGYFTYRSGARVFTRSLAKRAGS